jgi:hypothetical protein
MLLKEKKKSRFNRYDWLNFSGKRIDMVADLDQRELLLNLTKKEVVNFLGYEINDAHSNIWSYYIGHKILFFFPQKKHLYIHFDNKGLVYKTEYNF